MNIDTANKLILPSSGKKLKSINETQKINTINLLTDKHNTLGTVFHGNSSNSDYNWDFLNSFHRYDNSINTVNSYDITQTQLICPLKIEELEDYLFKCNSKIPGSDGIPYSSIKNFPNNNSKNYLLALYNTI